MKKLSKKRRNNSWNLIRMEYKPDVGFDISPKMWPWRSQQQIKCNSSRKITQIEGLEKSSGSKVKK